MMPGQGQREALKGIPNMSLGNHPRGWAGTTWGVWMSDLAHQEAPAVFVEVFSTRLQPMCVHVCLCLCVQLVIRKVNAVKSLNV
jgi:hypothetical protein